MLYFMIEHLKPELNFILFKVMGPFCDIMKVMCLP